MKKFLKEAISFKLAGSSPYLVSVFVWILLYFSLFSVNQSAEMLGDFSKVKPLPWITIFLYFLFGWNLFYLTGISKYLYNDADDNSGEVKLNKIFAAITLGLSLVAVAVLFINGWGAQTGKRIIAIAFALFLGVLTHIVLRKECESTIEYNKFLWKYGATNFILLILILLYSLYPSIIVQSGLTIGLIDSVIIFLVFIRFLCFLLFLIRYNFNEGLEILLDNVKPKNWGLIVKRSAWVLVILGVYYVTFWNKPSDRYRIQGKSYEDDRVTLEQYFNDWIKPRVKEDTIINVYLIAGQGGGSRGAYTTYKALEHLTNTIPEFRKNLFAVSTVSGSTVGAAIYRQSYYKLRDSTNGIKQDMHKRARAFFGGDFVTQSAFNYLIQEPFSEFSSFLDRNAILKRNYINSYNSIYKDLIQDNRIKPYKQPFPIYDNSRPARDFVFIANSFNIQDAKRAIISPVRFTLDRNYDDVIGNSKTLVSLPTAVNMSEMFPYLSGSASIMYPETSTKTNKDTLVQKNFYDGGVYDNYGIASINDIYQELTINKALVECDKNYRFVCIYLANSSESVFSDVGSSSGALMKAITSSTFEAGPNRERILLQETMDQYGDILVSIDPQFKAIQLNRWLSQTSMDSIESIIPRELDKELIPVLDNLSKEAVGQLVLNFDAKINGLTSGSLEQIINVFSCNDEQSIASLVEIVQDTSSTNPVKARESAAVAAALKKLRYKIPQSTLVREEMVPSVTDQQLKANIRRTKSNTTLKTLDKDKAVIFRTKNE